jgi:LPXTG-site transpeptidase (sortase) family protein
MSDRWRHIGKRCFPTLIFGGIALGLLVLLTVVAPSPPGSVEPSSSAKVLAADQGTTTGGATLPRAWATSSPTPLPTVTASPTQPATPTVTPSPTATASATPIPTFTPSPTPTPLHPPADGDPTRIQAPTIKLDAPVVSMNASAEIDGLVTWRVAEYAAGFHRGTARPGHVGNTVIAGHNNILGEVFRNLHRLEPGDTVVLWVGSERYHYQVHAVYRLPVTGAPMEILRDNLRLLSPTADQRLTLITCWPPWSNTHRVVIVCFPAPYNSEA